MLRPHDSKGLTRVYTELKLLQIDLDEKYQELISTVWIEMVIIFWIGIKLNKQKCININSHGVIKD